MFDSMDGLLHDPAILVDFQTKLEAEFAAESLLFYRATLEFDALIATRDRAAAPTERGVAEGAVDDSSNGVGAFQESKAGGYGDENAASALEAKCYAKAVAIFDEFIKPNSNNQV